MKTIGNLLWFIFGGFISGITWVLAGLLCCITIVGIPLGRQCFKFASLSIWPFGRDVECGGGVGRLLLNILWIIFGGLIMAILHALIGVLYREPSIIDTFMESYDFSGKTVIPFATSGSSGIGDSGKNMQTLAPGAKVETGKRFNAGESEEALKQWASEWV